jgi:chromosomal replication initiator protein
LYAAAQRLPALRFRKSTSYHIASNRRFCYNFALVLGLMVGRNSAAERVGMAGEQLELGDDDRSITLKRAWGRAVSSLASVINKAAFEGYIRPIQPVSYDDGVVTLGVASAWAREWLKKYLPDIRAALEEHLCSPLDIRFTLITPEERPLFGSAPTTVQPEESARPFASARAPVLPAMDAVASLPLNEDYTFDRFVVGKSNRLAHAGAAAVAGSPGTVYNPLFIYGSSGLGKTHLLHAIGHSARERDPRLRVALIDGETFTQRYVGALRDKKMDLFRSYFRSMDIWLVDDIQFIAGREQTKEEFYHTFNALYQSSRQIVIASDRSPRELRTTDERLRSRFESGLIADVNAPELETRAAILEQRCDSEDWAVPKEVLFYIADAIQSNVRTLQGALTKLVAYSSIMRTDPSIEVAQSVLGEYYIDRPLPGHARKDVPVDMILQVTADEFGTTVETLRGERRDKETVKARQVAMYLCREICSMPLAQIGAALGGRDHTTAQRGIARLEGILLFDRPLHARVQSVKNRLER